jgi:hypothetical protein
MKENTKMEDYDGFPKSKKIQRTRILPLRWIGNTLSYPAVNSLVKAFDLQEQNNLGYRFKFHSMVWRYLNKPYELWGTVYEVDIKGYIDKVKQDPDFDKLMKILEDE